MLETYFSHNTVLSPSDMLGEVVGTWLSGFLEMETDLASTRDSFTGRNLPGFRCLRSRELGNLQNRKRRGGSGEQCLNLDSFSNLTLGKSFSP